MNRFAVLAFMKSRKSQVLEAVKNKVPVMGDRSVEITFMIYS
jgi:hypothetical protein